MRIFAASPGDLSDERQRLERVVLAMNQTGKLADKFGLTLELLRWETHVAPDTGEAQGVVFDQLRPADWTIFVGLLWKRFGTPTGRVDSNTGEDYRSGTEEEFKAALRLRRERGGGWPKIMFYRCVRAVDPRIIDPQQFGLVQEFFRQFEPGAAHPGLVSEFGEPADFERQVREHLEKALLELVKERTEAASSIASPPGQALVAGTETRQITRPGIVRRLLDHFPGIHRWLTLSVGSLDAPPEWQLLHNYLATLRSTIENEITERTYIESQAKALPESADRYRPRRSGFLTPIQQLIREILGSSHGGDAQSAQISAISKRSKVVRNIVRRLLSAEEPLILLGDPGTGKSITLQQTAMLMADRESRRLFPKVCLLVRLGEFRSTGLASSDEVWAYVKRCAPADLRPYLDSLDALGRLVVLFDGMDEMSRDRYNEHTIALSVFAGRTGRAKTLFSCRITDFTPRFQHSRLVLLAFERPQIYRYLKRQLTFPVRVGGHDWSARELATRLTEPVGQMHANNPFVLWLLCNYLQEQQVWPQSRVDLLGYYNRRNYERKMSAQDSDRLRPDRDRVFLAWGRLAYEITSRNQGAVMPLDEVERLFANENAPVLAAGLRCGVLQESLDLEKTLIRFEHHRFQEYFTAHYLSQDASARAGLLWLERLDAPRWQETLLNLVLMGKAQEGLTALTTAIEDGVAKLSAGPSGQDPRRADLERLLADRVELASRIVEHIRPESVKPKHDEKARPDLLGTLRRAAHWLADNGNPITQVKMLWAAKAVPSLEVFRVAREPLASKVSWVRQQALIVSSASAGAVGSSALHEDLLHNFASGGFLVRFGGYLRIARAVKQRRVWWALCLGLVLTLAQLAAGAAAVEVVRRGLRTVELEGILFNRAKASADIAEKIRQASNQEERDRLSRQRDEVLQGQADLTRCFSAAKTTLGSSWFVLTLAAITFIVWLETLRRAPGCQLLGITWAGLACIVAVVLFWLLWLAPALSVLLGVITAGGLCLGIFLATFPVALLIQVSVVMLCASATSPRSRPIRGRRSLLEALWQSGGYKKIFEPALLLTVLAALSVTGVLAVDHRSVISSVLVAKLGLFPGLPGWPNVLGSLAIYAAVAATALSVAIRLWRGSAPLTRRLKKARAIALSCLSGLSISLLIWGLALVSWKRIFVAIGIFLGVFPRLPGAVNAALSLFVYLQLLGFIWVWWSHRGLRLRAKASAIVPWSLPLIVQALVALAIWRLSTVDWQRIGDFLVRSLGLFPRFPVAVNLAESLAVYGEIVACLLVVFIQTRRGPRNWRSVLPSLARATIPSLSLAAATLLCWGIYKAEDRFRILAVFLVFVVAVLLLYASIRELYRLWLLLWWPLRSARMEPEIWKQELAHLDAAGQAASLRYATPERLALTAVDFLVLLQGVRGVLAKEPALSAYWAKRFEIEEMLRQDRTG